VNPFWKALLADLDDEAKRELAGVLKPYLEPQPADEDPWIETAEAAAHLGMSVDQLHKLTAARQGIPFSQDAPGCKLYFKRSKLDAWRG
jgi:hypothetical protein